MATSPPYAGSPPGGVGTPISRKRPSLSTQISGAKRRKPSTAGPSHLRQTSFPPEEFPTGGRSPSVDSAAIGTPSVISGLGLGTKRGKRAATGSLIAAPTSGSKVNGTSGRGGSRSQINGEGAADDDEEDDEAADEGNLQGEEGATEEQRQRQEIAVRLLKESFTRQQSDVYDQFNHIGRTLMPRIRKLANHTLSQSVPQSVVMAIGSYVKVFMGEVIEEARRVQVEWQAADSRYPDGSAVAEGADLKERTKEEWRGPLLPDHLREAVRRMKKDRVGGAGGFAGVSLAGKERTAPKMGGRRLFR